MAQNGAGMETLEKRNGISEAVKEWATVLKNRRENGGRTQNWEHSVMNSEIVIMRLGDPRVWSDDEDVSAKKNRKRELGPGDMQY